jgi:hypothetical protein
MAEINIRPVKNKIFFLGDNEFETGILKVPASGTVPLGAFLLRGADGKFEAVTNTGTQTPVAVNPVEIKNTAAAPAEIPFRAMIAGRVRFDLLSVNGGEITDAQADMIRRYGNIPKKLTDISWT